MFGLLLNSMAGFSDIVRNALYIAQARNVAGIGTEKSGLAQPLGHYTHAVSGSLVCIDPAPSAQFAEWMQGTGGVRHIELDSHEAIATTTDIDAWIIGDDYNWYSVYNDLLMIEAAGQRDGRPLLAFVHHIGWPCARRDLYFSPEAIPDEFRHDHDYRGLAFPETTALVQRPHDSERQCFAFASIEGGPRNGVLTAIEDFIGEPTPEREFCLVEIPGLFGLGIIFDVAAPWSSAMADLLAPLHCSKLLTTLETNRLANYLQALEYRENERGGLDKGADASS